MYKPIALVGIILAVSCFVGGCGPKGPSTTLIYQLNSHVIPNTMTVGPRGLYALFPGDGITPLDGGAVYLNPGDQYGFQSHESHVLGFYTKDGQTKTIPLDGVLTTEYVWKYQGDKQP